MSEIRALVGQFDSGRLIQRGNEIVSEGGLAGDYQQVVDEIKRRNPEKVILEGEMLQHCVRFAVEDLLQDKTLSLKELIVDLRRCRGWGSDEAESGSDEPNLEQLEQRRLALVSRLPKEIRDDPRLKIIPDRELVTDD